MTSRKMALVSFSTVAYSSNADHLGVVKLDPWLEPFSDTLKRRYARAREWMDRIKSSEGGLEKFSRVAINVIQTLFLFRALTSPRASSFTV